MKYIVLIFCLVLLISCNEDIELPILKWEGAGARIVKHRTLILVNSIQDVPEKISPSIGNYIPDPLILSGSVIAGDIYEKNQKISLLIPRYILNGISVNSTVAIGFFDKKTIICIESSNRSMWETSCISKLDLPIT